MTDGPPLNDAHIPAKSASPWLSGFRFSLPIVLLLAVGFAVGGNSRGGGERLFVLLTIICLILSAPWNLIAAILIGLVVLPIADYFKFGGYGWLGFILFSAVFVGAHINGCLIFSRKERKNQLKPD